MRKLINKLRRDEMGATAIEYGLIAALIAIASITALGGIGDQLETTFGTVNTTMEEANGTGGGSSSGG